MRGHRAIQADWRRPGRPASTAAPAFPDNLVVFPNRDFIAVEGYQDHVGETATVEVTRPGVGVVGSAQGVVAEGDVAFEINHPGGYCRGAGTNLNITPDIQPGDVVSIRFGDTPAGDTVVQDGFVTADAVQNGTTVTVSGHVGPGLNRDNTEQRIVEPALTDTVVGRRDVRAPPGRSPRPPGAATPRAWSSRATPSPRPTCSTTPTRPRSRPTPGWASGCCPGRRPTSTATGRASPSPSSASRAGPAWAAAQRPAPDRSPGADRRGRGQGRRRSPAHLDPGSGHPRHPGHHRLPGPRRGPDGHRRRAGRGRPAHRRAGGQGHHHHRPVRHRERPRRGGLGLQRRRDLPGRDRPAGHRHHPADGRLPATGPGRAVETIPIPAEVVPTRPAPPPT
jgi:hypothetical protein